MSRFQIRNRVRHLIQGNQTSRVACPLAFVHIPKCAGTSLIAALKSALGPVNCQSMDHGVAYRAVRSQRAAWACDEWMISWIGFRQSLFHHWLGMGIPFVYGHMPVSTRTLEDYAESHGFFTVLRDPLERFISNYVYDKTGPGLRIPDVLPASESSPRDELALFLESPEARWMALEQVLMLAGLNDAGGFQPEEATERARANLERLALVGFTHDMPALMTGFKDTFGLALSIEEHNTTAGWIQKSPEMEGIYAAFDSEMRDRVEYLCRFERRLYEHALSVRRPMGSPTE